MTHEVAFAIQLVLALTVVGCERKAKPIETRKPQTTPMQNGVDAGSLEVAAEKVEIPEVRIRPDSATTVHVAWSTPPGTSVNEDAPFRVRWNRSDGLADAPSDVRATGSSVRDGFRVAVTPMAGAPNATLTGEIDLVVCDVETHSICVPVRRSLELGFIAVKDAAPDAKVTIPLPQAKAP